jgi:hypothetical protein
MSRDFAAARQLLLETQKEYPEALWPKVVYSHALLQEGCDLNLAEQVLREILAQAPEHHESRHNLSVLLGHLGRPAEASLPPSGDSSAVA